MMTRRKSLSRPQFQSVDRRLTVAAAAGIVVLFLLAYWLSFFNTLLSANTMKQPSSSSFAGLQDWYRDMVTNRLSRCQHTSTFFHYWLPHKQCHDKRRFGKCDDGAKWLCMDLFRGSTTKRAAAAHERCVVYSFGSSDDSCFETAVAEHLDCEIHIFDPTSSELKDDRWTYHSYGLGGADPSITTYWDWRTQQQSNCTDCVMKTLPEIMEELGHSYIDILKVDIDGAEWRSFDYIYKYLKRLPTDQLQIELTGLDVTPLVDSSLAGGYKGNIRFWENVLHDGFQVFEIEPNYGTCNYRSKNRSVSVEYAMWR